MGFFAGDFKKAECGPRRAVFFGTEQGEGG